MGLFGSKSAEAEREAIEQRRFWMEGEDMIVDMSTPFVEHTDEGEDMVLNMGPQHPSTHGVLRLELVADGEIVKRCIPHIGYLHRCFEKHAENLPYPEVIPFCDRMDYMASMNQDHAYAVAVEKMLAPELPERVEYIRVICAELFATPKGVMPPMAPVANTAVTLLSLDGAIPAVVFADDTRHLAPRPTH